MELITTTRTAIIFYYYVIGKMIENNDNIIAVEKRINLVFHTYLSVGDLCGQVYQFSEIPSISWMMSWVFSS